MSRKASNVRRKRIKQEVCVNPSDRIVDPDGLSKYLRRSLSWVYQNIAQIPHRKVGRLYLFHLDRIDEWLMGDASPETVMISTRNIAEVARERATEIMSGSR